MEAKPRPSAIAAIWIAGGLLALTAFLVGPDRFVERLQDLIWDMRAMLAQIAETLGGASFDLLRAGAIGLLIVFVLLAVMAIRRGLRGRAALVAVPLAYLWLIGAGPFGTTRAGWLMAFMLAFAGAASMTTRLLRANRAVTRP